MTVASHGQSHVERAPDPALRGLVTSAWVQRIDPGAAPYAHRHLPNGSVELACTVGAAPRVIGPLTAPLTETITPDSTVVGVRFAPGAFPAVAGLPASELTGVDVAAEAIWGRAAARLGEAVAASASPQAALAVLERHVVGRARDGGAPDPLVSAAVRGLMPWRTGDVGSLRATLHISETQLRRRCLSAVGLGPKALHRMLRFQGFLALVQESIARHRAPTESLARLAMRVGYADQAHLSRECVRLTGVPPRTFLAQTRLTCTEGHDHAASFAPLLQAEPAGLRPGRL